MSIAKESWKLNLDGNHENLKHSLFSSISAFHIAQAGSIKA
jgi:hypothetical protein